MPDRLETEGQDQEHDGSDGEQPSEGEHPALADGPSGAGVKDPDDAGR